MKKCLQHYSSLLFLGLVLSCSGQQKTEPQKVTPQETHVATTLSDIDPYFTESTGITSSYGPKSITRNIIQDKKGNIWFATWEGIICYDGNIFTNFTNKEDLKRFHVFALFEDTSENIWFGTIGAGIYRYDGESFTHFSTKEGLVNNSIGCIMEDKNGAIWIGTQGGVSKYDENSFTNFTKADGLSNNDVNSIVEDRNGKLWIGTRGTACVYDGKIFTEITNKKGRPFTNVRSILEDTKGNMWLGGNDGLWSYDGSTFNNFTKDFVGYIYQDREENIWTSSSSGARNQWVLTKYDKRSLAMPFQIKAEKGMFFGITEDNKGNIWLGTLNGVYRYDGTTFDYFKE